MFTKAKTNIATPDSQRIVPVRPAADPGPAPAAVTLSALRRTFGRFQP